MADFDKAFAVLMALEGGYVHHPSDPGGETKFGITQKSYPHLDIQNLTREDAKKIYLQDWWAPNRYGEIRNQDIAEKVFSLAVNMGAATAHKLLQMAVNKTDNAGLAVDGIIGSKTLAAVNNARNPDHVLAELKLLAVRRYLDIGVINFLPGWIRRALA